MPLPAFFDEDGTFVPLLPPHPADDPEDDITWSIA